MQISEVKISITLTWINICNLLALIDPKHIGAGITALKNKQFLQQ